MGDYFFDSSALAKRYIQETGSAWVESTTAPVSAILFSSPTLRESKWPPPWRAESRGGKSSAADALSAVASLERDLVAEYLLTDISFPTVTSAMSLAGRHALRAYDAVQLAVAITVNQNNRAFGLMPVVFVSADDALNSAARAEGLAVENPNHHP